MKKFALLKINPDLHHALKLKAVTDKTTMKVLGNGAIENLLNMDKFESYLTTGTLAKQNGQWWLFAANGNGICSGVTLFDLILNLRYNDL